MNKKVLLASVAACILLTACYVGPAYKQGDPAVVIAPALPSLVILGDDPYYRHSDYFYFYDSGIWFYSQYDRGPWTRLPRDRWPNKVERKGRGHDNGPDRDHDNGRRGHDDGYRR